MQLVVAVLGRFMATAETAAVILLTTKVCRASAEAALVGTVDLRQLLWDQAALEEEDSKTVAQRTLVEAADQRQQGLAKTAVGLLAVLAFMRMLQPLP